MSDIVSRSGRLHERVRALETGAHPTPVLPGGYGRNTRWLQLYSPTPGVELWAKARSDIVHFRTEGGGVAVVSVGDNRRPFSVLPRRLRPGAPARVLCMTTTGAVSVVKVRTNGHLVVESHGGGGLILTGRGYALG